MQNAVKNIIKFKKQTNKNTIFNQDMLSLKMQH